MLKLFISFSDGKILTVNDLEEQDLDHFFDCLKKNKMYWNKMTGRGFWLNSNSVYHIVAEKVPIGEENASQENTGGA